MQAAPLPHAALGPLRARAARRSKRSSGTRTVPPARPRCSRSYSTLGRRDSANRRPAELNQLGDSRGIWRIGPIRAAVSVAGPAWALPAALGRDRRRRQAPSPLPELRRVDARSWWACLVAHAHPLRAPAPGAGGQIRGQDVALVPAGPTRVGAGPRGATDMYRLSHDQTGGYPRWRRPHIRRRPCRRVDDLQRDSVRAVEEHGVGEGDVVKRPMEGWSTSYAGSRDCMSTSRAGRPRSGGKVEERPEETFVQIVSRLDYPMVVVTARSDDGPAGCLVGFVTQCSIHPPRYLVCLSDANRTERIAARADVLAVHFLAARDVDLARMFGEDTTDETDTFSRCRWHPGPGGAPILDDCGRWLVGTIFERQTSRRSRGLRAGAGRRPVL